MLCNNVGRLILNYLKDYLKSYLIVWLIIFDWLVEEISEVFCFEDKLLNFVFVY